MKILFLCEPKSPNTVSWAEGLRAEGCEVFQASARTDGSDGSIPLGNPLLPPRLRILTATRQLRKIISEIKPDILLAYRITSYGYLAAKTGFHPLVLAAQNENIVFLPENAAIRRKLLTKFARFAIREADLIHSWGENITRGLLEFGAEPQKILTLHRGINLQPYNSPSFVRDNTFNKDAPRFISTRSLAPEYLIDILLKAFRLVLDEIPGAVLDIVGSGSEELSLKNLAEQLNLGENIRFLGRVGNSEIPELLKNADIYISLIRTEGISSSLIEAVTAELFPVVSDMPASRLLVENNTNGLLLSGTSPESVAEKMIEAVGMLPDRRAALSENRKKISENYDRTGNQKIFIEKYRTLIRNPVGQ
jgi:glycosyltransferase involved in cell wall biosynthesis